MPPAKSATPKPAPQPSLEQITLAANVDELGALEREFAPLKFKIDRIDVLRRAIREHYAASDAATDFTANGEKFTVLVGPKSREMVVNIPALVKAIGAKFFLTIASVTKKNLDAAVSAETVATVTSYENTGFRSLRVFEKGTNA